MRCRPADKEGLVSRHPCFRCLRTPKYSEMYDFIWDCALDVMLKMTNEELNILSQQVLAAMRDKFDNAPDDELILLGDCYARVLAHTIKRGHYLRGSYVKVPGVREIVRIAADKSMPAWGLWSAMERDDLPIPTCWRSMHRPWGVTY